MNEYPLRKYVHFQYTLKLYNQYLKILSELYYLNLYYVFGLKIGCLLLFLLVKKLIFNSNQKTSYRHQIGPKLFQQKIYSILVSEESPWNLVKNVFWIMKIGQLVQKIWPKNRKKNQFFEKWRFLTKFLLLCI